VPDRAQPGPEDDGLPIPEVGQWALKKHHFLRRYIYAFTTSMRGKWSRLHYIDLFASAGIVRIEGHGLGWGSPLLAATTAHPFSRLHVCERDEALCAALRERLKRAAQPEEPQIICGDANEVVGQIVAAVPRTSLNLAFVDPHALDELDFETLRTLATRRTDMIIFFPDLLDAIRNIEQYRGKPDSHLSRFMGTTAWERALENEPRENWPHVLFRVFRSQLESPGYSQFEEERVSRGDAKRLYKLVFCSADPTGAKLWRNVSKKHFGGQRKLFD